MQKLVLPLSFLAIVLTIITIGAVLDFTRGEKEKNSQEEIVPQSEIYNGEDLAARPQVDLEKSAKKAEFLEIKGCNPEPNVWQVSRTQELIVKNSDTKERTIVFDQKNKFKIPAGGQSTITYRNNEVNGPYGYGCDAFPDTVGYIFPAD